MCGLCSSNKDVQNKARDEVRELAATLRKHADQIEQMARGSLKPHTDDAKGVGITARYIVRELVNDWV